MSHPESVQTLIDSMLTDRDEATAIVVIDFQPYAVRIERIKTPEQMQRATDEFKETFSERSH